MSEEERLQSSYSELTSLSENDIDGVLELTFSTDDERFGETVTIDLKPNGRNIEVTNENKKEYVEYVDLSNIYTTPRLTDLVSSPNGEYRSASRSNSPPS